MGLFGKKPPAYTPVGRGFELTDTGQALRRALLAGEPRQIAELSIACADERDGADRLAVHIAELVRAYVATDSGDVATIARLASDEPATFPSPERPKDEPEQYMDHACERLFEGATLMLVLQDERFADAPEHQRMLDTFVSTFKWTRNTFNSVAHGARDIDMDVAIGIGKHHTTFDGVVATLISNNNLRQAAR